MSALKFRPRNSEQFDRLQEALHSLITAHENLDELTHLEPNWDSYGGIPPAAQAISAANGLLLKVWNDLASSRDRGMFPWTTAPLNNGGVQFEWKGANGVVEVEVSPKGKLSYLVDGEDGTMHESAGEVPADEVIRCIRGILNR